MRDFACTAEAAEKLKAMAKRMRLLGLEMARSTGSKGAHLGGSFSCMEILAVLYGAVLSLDPKNPHWPERDRFIPSKNHCTLAHFPALCEAGYISENEAMEFQKDGGRLTGYPRNLDVGLEYSGGSLGQAISVAIGICLALRRRGSMAKAFVLLGDGELDEGSNWEAFMAASQYRLDSLVAVIDRNHLSYDGDTEKLMALEPLDEKFRAFGWNAIKCDGHDPLSLLQAFSALKPGMPNAVIADTVKGKGISFLENQPRSHHCALTQAQYEQAKAEILAG